MRKAAELVRSRVDAIARTMTTEQGKPLIEAKGEIMLAADLIEWFAEESRRTYGRVIPAARKAFISSWLRSRSDQCRVLTVEFPINQAVARSAPRLPQAAPSS